MILRNSKQTLFGNLRIEGNFINLTKNVCKTSKTNIPLNGEILQDFPNIGNEIKMSPSSLLFNTALEVLACAKREGGKKKYKDWKERKLPLFLDDIFICRKSKGSVCYVVKQLIQCDIESLQRDQQNRKDSLEADPHIYRSLIYDKIGPSEQWENEGLFKKWFWINWIFSQKILTSTS